MLINNKILHHRKILEYSEKISLLSKFANNIITKIFKNTEINLYKFASTNSKMFSLFFFFKKHKIII